MSKQEIPEAAVEAAAKAMALRDHNDTDAWAAYKKDARVALEAASPHMREDASADVAAAFANVEAAKLALVARVAGVDPEVARSLGYRSTP